MLNRRRIIFHKILRFLPFPKWRKFTNLKTAMKGNPIKNFNLIIWGEKNCNWHPKKNIKWKKKNKIKSANRRNQNISPPEGCNASFVLFSSSINFSKTHTILKLWNCLGSDGGREPAALHHNSFWFSSNNPSAEASLAPPKHACQSLTSYIKNTAISWLPSKFRIKS